MPPRVTLYSFVTSPFAAKVKLYPDNRRLRFELVYVDPLRAEEIAFTGQRRVPGLQIDAEWRRDSSAIGIRLDERFAERPLPGETPADCARILELDEWATVSLIPAVFRQAIEWDSLSTGFHNGSRLSGALMRRSRCRSRLASPGRC